MLKFLLFAVPLLAVLNKVSFFNRDLAGFENNYYTDDRHAVA